ncbi:HNH endonuclease [Sulfuricurvum kujiense DSM 16994]|uniref:HNH endonuclease n=1 Tax=Sulfuricurvum kujiense (strain ATCC BAA-921 / DSM 16994 / JCM 11577 / YK-1) TaxID=709032 RepID=E4TYD8_SULKY|nr:HNH endonuclease signature motif containing protein [Sulfuricurvum kujiense]ADR35083.1 HNH endonuclease [Sulfuricurvum kujiense DSM 16994]
MTFQDYLQSLPIKKSLSDVKHQILERLWQSDDSPFPKEWVASKELLQLTGQKYFDRRAREIKDKLGCDLETSYVEDLKDHAWRLNSKKLTIPINREYLTKTQKKALFEKHNFICAICGTPMKPGVRGLQADHKTPLSRGGTNELNNWQSICNVCNVGKRRACEKCVLDCNECSWAFPEIVGIATIVNIDHQLLDLLKRKSAEDGKQINHLIEEAIKAAYLK